MRSDSPIIVCAALDVWTRRVPRGLIDEVSMIVAPVADGRFETPALFDIEGDEVAPCRLILEKVEPRAADILWLRYRVDKRGG